MTIAGKDQQVWQVILMHFWFRTRPEMSYVQEGYQKGPLHVGRVQITFRAYAWTEQEITTYKKMRDREDFKLLGMVDSSVKAAMESLGDELMRYLEEAGEEVERVKEQKEKPKKLSPLELAYKGFREMFSLYRTPQQKRPASARPKKSEIYQLDQVRSEAVSKVKGSMWGIYHHFKKHHGMLNW